MRSTGAVFLILPALLLAVAAAAEDGPAQVQAPAQAAVGQPISPDSGGNDPAKLLEEALSLRDPFKRPDGAMTETITV